MVIRAIQTLRELSDDYEIIVINDRSSDDSLLILSELVSLYPSKIRIVNHENNLGYGGALRSGFATATKEWIFYTDGDAQYDVRELKLLVEKISEEVDFINGWKIKRHDPLFRVVIGIIYQYFIKWLFGLHIKDVDCDFRLMRHEVFKVIDLESNSGTITFELVKKAQDAGFCMVEVPVHHYYRQLGESQFFNFSRVARTLIGILHWWWRLVIKKEAVHAYRSKRKL